MITFSAALSIFTISSKSKVIFFDLLLVSPGLGELPMKRGGVSSNGPPSGVPGLAQEYINMMARKTISKVCFLRFILLIVHRQNLIDVFTIVA